MKTLPDIELWEKPLESSKIPEIELYMDQLLSLTEEKGITKTMINNYSKEHLIKPLKGKKYSKEQIIQILFIMNLKQNISLGEIKEIMPQQDGLIDYKKVYDFCAAEDEKLAKASADFAKKQIALDENLSKEEQVLAAAMMLSSCCNYFKNLCEAMIGDLKSTE